MVRRLHASTEELGRIARDLLNLNLSIVASMEKIGRFNYDISWIVSRRMVQVFLSGAYTVCKLTQYGLPAAGVLALELLHQSQAGSRSTNNFPRSEVVQNLSRLIAYIKPLVRKEDTNYVLCNQARRVIQSILDQVLSLPLGSVTSGGGPGSQLEPGHEDAEGPASETIWLPGAQSELEFWTNLPEHPLLTSSGP